MTTSTRLALRAAALLATGCATTAGDPTQTANNDTQPRKSYKTCTANTGSHIQRRETSSNSCQSMRDASGLARGASDGARQQSITAGQ